ncbi:MAG: hypothetical protein WC113_04640 [Candidatus Paceibacterota bacterium]|jgi:hypothetical protein
MIAKNKEKEKAVSFRKEGCSYNEILKIVPVAKSTLSLWLREVGLSNQQKQRLTEKKLAAARRGGEAKRNQRIFITEKIKSEAQTEILKISKRELWLIGIALYWAEGNKEKNYKSGKLCFNNSDPKMVLLFRKWLVEICKIPTNELIYSLYIHEKSDWRKAKNYWAETLSIDPEGFKVYFKKHSIKTNRKNTGDSYKGLIRIVARRSTNLNRKISGWIEGICQKSL